MIDIYFNNIQIVAWTAMFIMGCYLLTGNIPNKISTYQYARARKLMGIAYVIIGIQFLLQFCFKTRLESQHLASAINITFFIFSGSFVAYSFITILNNSFINRFWVIIFVLICSILSITVLSSFYLFSNELSLRIQ